MSSPSLLQRWRSIAEFIYRLATRFDIWRRR
jgi:hypothetical protein